MSFPAPQPPHKSAPPSTRKAVVADPLTDVVAPSHRATRSPNNWASSLQHVFLHLSMADPLHTVPCPPSWPPCSRFALWFLPLPVRHRSEGGCCVAGSRRRALNLSDAATTGVETTHKCHPLLYADVRFSRGQLGGTASNLVIPNTVSVGDIFPGVN